MVKLGDKLAIDPLIQTLNDNNIEARQFTALALGKLGDKRAVYPLIQALNDNNSKVRACAAIALGRLRDQQAIKPLIQALHDKEDLVRLNAAEALGAIGDARAVEPLIRVLRDKRGEARVSAITALGELGDKRAIDPILQFLFEKPRNTFDLEYGKRVDKSSHESARILATIESALLSLANYNPSYPSVSDILEASGYYRDYLYPIPQTGHAVQATERLCKQESPITSNVLHLVAQKKNLYYNPKVRDGFVSAEKKKLDFQKQRNMAKEELEKRGNPPYQPKAYLES